MSGSCGLIAALDFNEEHACLEWVDKLDPAVCALKVGSVLFTSCGPQMVKRFVTKGFRVFLDLKFHDIPNTVAMACKAAADLGVWMMNVHALGGVSMLEAAQGALESYGAHRPLLIAVTILTSHSEGSLKCLGIETGIEDEVQICAKLAYDVGLDGVVCSGFEVPRLKQTFGEKFLTVTPGIRLGHEHKDDQRRVLTPKQAKERGSDYLVLGRALQSVNRPDLLLLKLDQELNGE